MTSPATFRRALAASLLLAGCALPHASTAPTPEQIEREWTTVLALASSEMVASRYPSADRLLTEFQQRYPAAPSSQTALFYRALFRLDPANPAASNKEAIVLLDTYLASPADSSRRADAQVLRRLATALEAKPAVVTVTTPGKEKDSPATKSDSGAKDEEVARLKEELSKANAELERIRRRLSAPKP